MTTWTKKKSTFEYHYSNEKKDPKIQVDFYYPVDDCTSDIMIIKLGLKKVSKNTFIGLQTCENRLYIAHELDKHVQYDIDLRYARGLKKCLPNEYITFFNKVAQFTKIENLKIDYTKQFIGYQKSKIVLTIDPDNETFTTFERKKEKDTYKLIDGKFVELSQIKLKDLDQSKNELIVDYENLPF